MRTSPPLTRHRRALRRGRLPLGIALVCSMCALSALAQPITAKKDKTPAAIKLPSGAIIVVTDKIGETLQKTDAVFLSPEKYQELKDQIDQLKRQLAAEKPTAPSVCEI